MNNFYTKNKNTIIGVGVVSALVILLALLLPKKDKTGGNIAISEDTGEINNNDNQTFNASDVANQLYAIMSDLGWFSSSDILAVFTDRVPRTNTAFEKLKSAFGLRQHNQVTGGTSFGKNRNLIEWLKSEMNAQHYKTLKSFYPNQAWI